MLWDAGSISSICTCLAPAGISNIFRTLPGRQSGWRKGGESFQKQGQEGVGPTRHCLFGVLPWDCAQLPHLAALGSWPRCPSLSGSGSCHPHRPHICPPASGIRPPCRSQHAVTPGEEKASKVMAPCLWHHHVLSPTLYTKSVHGLKYTSPTSQDADEGNARASSLPGSAPYHALAPDADAVGIPVAAPGSIVNNLVHEYHIPRPLGLADQLALLSIWAKQKVNQQAGCHLQVPSLQQVPRDGTHRRDARRAARHACCHGGCSMSHAWSTAGHGNPHRVLGIPRCCTPGAHRWLLGSCAHRKLGWKIKQGGEGSRGTGMQCKMHLQLQPGWEANVRRVTAAPAARAHTATTRPGAGAELGPGAPAAILAVGLF